MLGFHRLPVAKTLLVGAALASLVQAIAVGAPPLLPETAWDETSYAPLEYPGSIRSELPTEEGSEAPLLAFPESSLAWCGEAMIDAAVEPAQMSVRGSAAVRQRRSTASSQRAAAGRAAQVAVASSLASVPYMIGDTGAGTCIGFTGMVDAQMAHPSLACGRLNIAESNTPLPTDRVYYSYRHFHNASRVSGFQFVEDVNYERHMLAGEKTFFEGVASVEMRVPIERRLTSNITTMLRDDLQIYEPIFTPGGETRETDLGNIAIILKCLVWEREWWAMSGGLGIRPPTARDVNYNLGVLGPVTYTNPPGLSSYQLVAFVGEFENETVYLEPFLAWIVAPPGSRWFHQGFLQVEAAANPSTVTMMGGGVADFYQDNVFIGTYGFSTGPNAFDVVPVQTKLHAQTLMRLNLGTGYRLIDEPDAPLIQNLAAMFEAHYTTTLQDAKLSSLPMTFVPPGTAPFQDVRVGNLNNRVDIVNVAAGLSAGVGRWTITNGAIAPVRRSPNRGFDFEYNVQVQRPF